MDEPTRAWATRRRDRQSSTGPAATYETGRDFCDGLSVGAAVFAPKRQRTKTPHYALAEITGVQACAGTATVSFAGAEPGVDDEAVPLYTLVPFPRRAFAAAAADANACSLAQPISHVAAQSGHSPPDMTRGAGLLCDSETGSETGHGIPLSVNTAPPLLSSGPTALYSLVSDESGDEDDWRALHITHTPPESADAFYARAFRAVRRAFLCDLPNISSTQPKQLVLCVFGSYNTLRRFNVYMAFRGHRLQLIDDTSVCSTTVVTQGTSQHSALDPLWLCLLAEDVEDENAATVLLKNWLPLERRQESGGVNVASIAVSVVWFIEDFGEGDSGDGQNMDNSFLDVAAGAAVNRFLSLLSSSASLITCRLSCSTQGDELVATSLLAGHRLRWRQGTTLELMVPASTWQLELIRLLRDRKKIVERGGIGSQQRQLQYNGDDLPSRNASSLSPFLLQAIACGNMFDATLTDALASLPGGTQLFETLKGKMIHSGSFFGDEAFPVLAAVRAALDDVLPASFSGHGARCRRVALVLSDSSDRRNSGRNAAAYLHAIQRFLYPRHLFTLTATEQQQPSIAALMDSSAWLESGGVLLLNPGDPLCRLSSLLDEASTVITCSKATASALQAANSRPTHIALFSEVEFVDDPAHSCTLWRDPAGQAPVTNAEQAVLSAAIAEGRGGAGLPSALAMAAALLHRLERPGGEEKNAGKKEAETRLTHKGTVCYWAHLRRFAEEVLLCGCRASSPVLINEGAAP